MIGRHALLATGVLLDGATAQKCKPDTKPCKPDTKPYGGFPLSVHYGASKTAVRQFTKSVALHCAQKGYAIRCNSIHPGPTMTGLMKASIARAPSEEEGRARWMAQTPIGRFAEPEEMASLVTWLVSDEATYVTGAEFVSDGGMTAGMGAG